MFVIRFPDLIKDVKAKIPVDIQVPDPLNEKYHSITISGIDHDSRKVEEGHLFVALTGGQTDGHQYISKAITRGAVAVIGELPITGLQVPYLRVANSRIALAYAAASFYRFPAHQMTVIGVTGTDGKTTTATLIYQILKSAGIRAGMISTVSAFIGDVTLDTGFHVTTPEAQEVQQYLAQMVSAGLTHVVLEATSHGLAQHRVTACDFDIGVVTNITHEHLDYHGSYREYFNAKASLFEHILATPPKRMGSPKVAILNREDRSYDPLVDRIGTLNERAEHPIKVFSYGLDHESDLSATDIKISADQLEFVVQYKGSEFQVQTRLVGEYNVSNCLAAISATVVALGVDAQAAQSGIRELANIPGRMEFIELGQDFLAVVDFAHTPNALFRALQTVRKILNQMDKNRRIIAIFGSAGLRDRKKRNMMAEISAELADITILTAEDPRTELLDTIIEEMVKGIEVRGGIEGESFWRIPDRGEAIRFGVKIARPGDLVIALGKGHEQSMCFGEIEYSWDDRTAMRAAISEHLGLAGPKMPYLPTQGQLSD